MIREAKREDLAELLELYLYLHEDSIPEMNSHLEKAWEAYEYGRINDQKVWRKEKWEKLRDTT